jgi:hypothetical protein
MSSGVYAEFEPRIELRPWVRLTWTYVDDQPSQVIQRIPPDGCPELIIHLGDPYEEEVAPNHMVRQPRVIFAGQMTRPIALRAAGPVRCVGLRFEPDGAGEWFGATMEQATDRRIDVSDLIESYANLDPTRCRGRLEEVVSSALAREGWPLDEAVRAEVRRLETGEPDISRPAAQRRRMQRRFLRQVGVSQRMLRSVLRFRKVFDHASGAGGAWLGAALDAGYFDQPQMARDFQRFLGCTATRWAREQVELARLIAAPRAAS